MKEIKLGICAIIKDTPDYLMKEWIEYHFNNGVNLIHVFIDCDSKPIYQDERVIYTQLTPKSKEKFIDDGVKYCIHKDLGSNIQVGIYNYALELYRDKIDWLALIDDDEFLVLDKNHLTYYNDKTCVLLPWKMMFTNDIKCQNSLKNYIEYPADEMNIGSPKNFKAIINLHKIWKVRAIHDGDYCGVMMDFPQYDTEYLNDRAVFAKMGPVFDIFNNAKNYIRHYKFRSFEEWISSVVDRGYLLYETYEGLTWNITISQFFGANPYYYPYLKKRYINKSEIDENLYTYFLELAGREDVMGTFEYEYSKFPSVSIRADNVVIVYNTKTNSPIDKDVIKQYTSANTKYVFVDYIISVEDSDEIVNEIYKNNVRVKKNDILGWTRLYLKQTGNTTESKTEEEAITEVCHLIFGESAKIEFV